MVYDIPEQPPCLTPILRQRSWLSSALILLRCCKALSVNVIAGLTLCSVPEAAERIRKVDRLRGWWTWKAAHDWWTAARVAEGRGCAWAWSAIAILEEECKDAIAEAIAIAIATEQQ